MTLRGRARYMVQTMLPFAETPTAPKAHTRALARPRSSVRKPEKLLEHRLTTALADPGRVVFLDVETTGLSWYYDELTIVGWACDGKYQFQVEGDDPALLLEALRTAQTLITFNGTLFDLRFLKKKFGDIVLPREHIDLRYLAKRVGLVGGQKEIERALGLSTRAGLEDLEGAGAVLLWHRYLRGDRKALARLIDYNRRDVLGMCGILDVVVDRLDVHPDLLLSRARFATSAAIILQQKLPKRALRGTARSVTSSKFETVFAGTPAEHAKIIGIDLTGSESRPTGWCTLRGSEAETLRICTDEEMLARVLAERPALISIDSPLSIPFGRSSVEDSDPGREQYGIMRRCERELKRRGINVYPCLLPSMQGLTRRGMRLAERFRAVGVPVIESYPGAAQDIMAIPRKGAGLEYLRQGLADFGIRGSFVDNPVSHDELDAITSALVGSFFLSGRYEALRGPTEGALIIPDLKAGGRSEMIIGISGRICAGKTTTARILEERGFAYTRFSQVIDEEILSRGEVPDRENRQRVGTEIHNQKGQRWLCEKVLERVGDKRMIVVDGLRFPEDHAFFVERFGRDFVHIYITAAEELRIRRYQDSEQDGRAYETVDKEPVEAKIEELSRLATTGIDNDSSVAQLERKVLNYLRTLAHEQNRECLSRLL